MVEGKKHDEGKPRWSLLPKGVLGWVIKVLMHGSEKYGDNNWMNVKPFKERYYNAAKRHINEYWEGEFFDKESGLPHLAHAICCLMFLLWKGK